ncbi:leucine rich repeat protein, partial [Leptospira santarosai str. HAI134]
MFVAILCRFCKRDAEKNKVYRDFNEALKNPMDVRILYLSDNQLATLPNEIGKLRKLEWLNLSNNRLTTLPNE